MALVTVTSVSGSAPSRRGMRLAVTEDETVYGSLGCDGFDRSAAHDGMQSIRNHKDFTTTYRWEEDSLILVEVKTYYPGEALPGGSLDIPELLVVGSGPVARSLVILGEAMGYHVRVAAGPASPSVGEFDGADEVIVTPTAEDVEALRPGVNTYVVICGHDDEFSIPVLHALMKSEVPYLGMMGSSRHTGRLSDELVGAGFSPAGVARVHSPVGLPIGSETPEEIALSILAQIVAVRRGAGRNLP